MTTPQTLTPDELLAADMLRINIEAFLRCGQAREPRLMGYHAGACSASWAAYRLLAALRATDPDRAASLAAELIAEISDPECLEEVGEAAAQLGVDVDALTDRLLAEFEPATTAKDTAMTQPAGQPLDLDPIQARANAATPGPWESTEQGEIYTAPEADTEMLWISVTGQPDAADAEFIAAARTDVPKLLAEVRQLREQLETAHVRLHHIQARVEETELTDPASALALDLIPWLDGPLHQSDIDAYRTATATP